MIISARPRPAWRRSKPTVVSGGAASRAVGMSSTPMTARSAGAVRPCSRMPASTAIAVSSLKAHTAVTDWLAHCPTAAAAVGDLQAHAEHDRRVDAGVRAGVRGAFEPAFCHLPQAGVRGHRVADAPVPAADQVLGLEAADRVRRGG